MVSTHTNPPATKKHTQKTGDFHHLRHVPLQIRVLELAHTGLVGVVAQVDVAGVAPELLVVYPELLHDDPVCLADGLDLEEAVHGLERDGLSLWDEEEDEDGREDHERGEEHVDAKVHGQEHLRREARDDEVPEPVGRRGGRLAQGPGVLVEHLRVDDPGRAVPRGRVKGRPQVEEEHGRDAARGKLARGVGVPGRVGHADVYSDDPHADRAAQATVYEKVASAEVVNHVPKYKG